MTHTPHRKGDPPPRESGFPPIANDGAPSIEDDDSEPRRKWKPNEELLRALADARKDLKPGESWLFWDWTGTRQAAPEAEEIRPSGEGEVFACDKEAAAAYVAPVKVAPSLPPRQSTKSRIRVREDVDPRRQPTVKTRHSDPDGRPVAAFRDARDSLPGDTERASSPSWPGDAPPASRRDGNLGERPAFVPADPPPMMRAGERRRRVAMAILLGAIAGTIVFFWLRFPHEKVDAPVPAPTPPPCAPASTPAAPGAVNGAPHDAQPPARDVQTPSSDAQTTSRDGPSGDAPTPSAERSAKPIDRAPTGTTTRPSQGAGAHVTGGAPSHAPASTTGSQPSSSGFLIRKKDGS